MQSLGFTGEKEDDECIWFRGRNELATDVPRRARATFLICVKGHHWWMWETGRILSKTKLDQGFGIGAPGQNSAFASGDMPEKRASRKCISQNFQVV